MGRVSKPKPEGQSQDEIVSRTDTEDSEKIISDTGSLSKYQVPNEFIKKPVMKLKGVPAKKLTSQGIGICFFPEQPEAVNKKVKNSEKLLKNNLLGNSYRISS